MITVLKVILAISVFLEITSTIPLQPIAMHKRSAKEPENNEFTRDVQGLYTNITQTKAILKKCGDKPIREIDFSDEPICSGYKKAFCEVNKALQNFSQPVCSSIVARIKAPKILVGGYDSCTITKDRITMKEFYERLENYIRTIRNRCLQETNVK